MREEEIKTKIEYLNNYIDLLKDSVKEAEQELHLLRTYIKFKDQ